MREDMSRLEQGVHIVVGTPGRVFDMINRRALFTDSIKLDQMLNNVDQYRPFESIHRIIAEKLTVAAGAKRRRVESTDSGSD